MQFITLNCDFCNQQFNKYKSIYKNAKNNRQQTVFFCSKACELAFKKKNKAKKVEFFCGFCQILTVPKHRLKPTKNNKHFCSHACANRYIAQTYPKKRDIRVNSCSICSAKTKSKIQKCKRCKNSTGYFSELLILTKQELFNRRKNWQSARSQIRKLAETTYKTSKLPYKCLICSYDKHIEICHIKAVKDFDSSTTLDVINHIDNLVALCRNHHWEQENNLIVNLTALIADR